MASLKQYSSRIKKVRKHRFSPTASCWRVTYIEKGSTNERN